MPMVIAHPCIGEKDTACVAVCPAHCIHPTRDEHEFLYQEQLYINPAECTSCGLCVQACPVEAIFAQEHLPARWLSFIQRNADYFLHPHPQRPAVRLRLARPRPRHYAPTGF